MRQQSGERVKQIFHEARDRPEGDRDSFVAAACRDDNEVRVQVEALLAADQEAGAFLASPTQGNASHRRVESETFDRLQRTLSGRFSLERELGRGGMGIVYLARDVALDRPVAVKLLPPELAAVPEFRERFLREARTAASFSHPNIVPIHLVEETDTLVFFVMAFVDGESLGDRVRRAGPLRPADAAKLLQEVAWALAYAHSRGVIHRDVKPDNIMIDSGSGRALVTDFGIAQVPETETLSIQGDVLGTLQYMSPEQATADRTIDGRADLYSLGVTGFFALTGRLPFESNNSAALITMHITEPAPPVKSMNGTVPARLAEVIDRCLAKNPDARIANGEALAEAIADAQVTRREIAPSVREFLTAARGATAQATVLGMMWWALLEALPRIEQSAILGNPLDAIFFLLAGITPIIFIRPFYAARGVIRAGLDQRDVAKAAASSATETDANVEYELARTERLANKLSKIWWRAGFLIMGAAMVPIVAEALTDVVAFGFPLWMLVHASFPVGALVFTLAMALAPRRFIAIITRGTPESGRLWHAFWAGGIGRWLFKIAGIGVKRGRPLSLPETAPTEVLLGRAADELYAQLPTAQRKRLGNMRHVIRRLEAAAGRLRERRDELATAIADIGEPETMPKRGALVAELRSEQSAVEARMAAAVGGLETLRLDLLRLRAGVGHPDDLTAAIEEARAVGDAVNVELAAYDEVEALTVQSNKRSDS